MEAPPPTLCAHCDFPLPSRPYLEDIDGERRGFCCAGCLTVFRLVGATGEAGRAGWFLAKLALAAILSGNVMMFQSLLYFGTLSRLGPDVWRTASAIMLVFSAAVYLLIGVPMLRTAWRALRQGRIVLEFLIGLGALAAIAASAAETLRGGRTTYYDSGTMVLVIVVAGQYLDARARQNAAERLSPEVLRSRRLARIRHGESFIEVPADEVRAGSEVVVRPGEEIPVDGRVVDGASDVHDPTLTGESMPRLVRGGDRVFAGSVALDGALTVVAAGRSRTLAEAVREWAVEARLHRAPIELAADRWVGWFVPAVAFVALAAAAGWGLARHDWIRGGLSALAVLVVACPCALGIATPMATTTSLAEAARRGVLVRGGEALERLASIDILAFDKTGTLTLGKPSVEAVNFAVEFPPDPDQIWSFAASLAAESAHPFSRAICEGAANRGIGRDEAAGVRATAGGGVSGQVSGKAVALGSSAFLRSLGVAGIAPSGTFPAAAVGLVELAIDGVWRAEFVLKDAPRGEAPEALAEIRRIGLQPCLLSGDRQEAVDACAALLGIGESRGDLLPGGKPDVILDWRRSGRRVGMVGEGINDAPALGAADVGIAFGAATDLARSFADVVVLREDLRELPALVLRARRTLSVVRQNLGWAFGYNAIAIALAALGLLRPVIAAAAMVLSSVLVVANSLRLTGRPGVPVRRP